MDLARLTAGQAGFCETVHGTCLCLSNPQLDGFLEEALRVGGGKALSPAVAAHAAAATGCPAATPRQAAELLRAAAQVGTCRLIPYFAYTCRV